MTIEETPSYTALVTKKAELAAAQTDPALGVQHPDTIAIGKQIGPLYAACYKEMGTPLSFSGM